MIELFTHFTAALVVLARSVRKQISVEGGKASRCLVEVFEVIREMAQPVTYSSSSILSCVCVVPPRTPAYCLFVVQLSSLLLLPRHHLLLGRVDKKGCRSGIWEREREFARVRHSGGRVLCYDNSM